MGRKSSTKTTENPTEQIMNAINTPINLEWAATAEKLNIAVPELQERVSNKLNDSTVFAWDSLPVEHQPLVEAIARDLESEASVRRWAPQPEEVPQLPEPPVLEEEVKPAKQTKRKSSSLTKTKSSKLKESDHKAQQLASSDQQVKVALHARKGQKSGAQLATIELAAEDLTYRKIKGEALLRKTAQLTSELATESGFDPIQVLNDLGIDSNSEIFEDLREQLEPALGKVESATAEIVDNAWVNGIDLAETLGNLEDLLNWND